MDKAILIILYVCLTTSIVIADDCNVIRITDNDYQDVGVEVHGSRLTWQASPEGSVGTEIFYYDGKKTIQLTDNDAYKCTPSISGRGIVWQEDRPEGGSDVFLYDFDLKRMKRLTDDDTADFQVTIYDGLVVWCKQRRLDGQVMLYDGNCVRPIEGAYGIFPRVSSGGIMYYDIVDENLYLYDWNDIIDLGKVSLEYSRQPHNQQINGDKLAWRSYINGYHEVFLHDISTGTTRQITCGEVNPSAWMLIPAVCGDYVAWTNRENDMNHLRLYDGRDILTLTNAYLTNEPFFGNGFLVWAAQATSNEDMEIFVYDLKSKEIKQITDDEHEDRYPVASKDYIAWQKYDGNDWEIYLAQYLGRKN